MKLDGKKVDIVPFTISTYAELERIGVKFDPDCPLALAVGMLAVSMGVTFAEASSIFERHCKNGGKASELFDEVTSIVRSKTAMKTMEALNG